MLCSLIHLFHLPNENIKEVKLKHQRTMAKDTDKRTPPPKVNTSAKRKEVSPIVTPTKAVKKNGRK